MSFELALLESVASAQTSHANRIQVTFRSQKIKKILIKHIFMTCLTLKSKTQSLPKPAKNVHLLKSYRRSLSLELQIAAGAIMNTHPSALFSCRFFRPGFLKVLVPRCLLPKISPYHQFTPNSQIQTMSNEEKLRFLSMPISEKRKIYNIKGNPITIGDIPTWTEYCEKNKLAKSGSQLPVNREHNERISIFRGDITTLEIDAIVNAANKELRGGGGVDGAIHRAAGHDLLQAECRKLNGCNIGQAKITGGYKLPAKYVVHTVGPYGEKPDKLSSCYNQCLRIMKENNLKSIAFPCISTGVYNYPNEGAAKVAISTVRNWLDNENYSSQIERIIFCLFLDEDVRHYHNMMPQYFPIE